MSRIFYDHLIIMGDIHKVIKQNTVEPEEREEMHQLIDEMIHHRVLGCILDLLPKEHHEDFLNRFHKAPYDDSLVEYLQQRIEADIEEKIKEEILGLKKELLAAIKNS